MNVSATPRSNLYYYSSAALFLDNPVLKADNLSDLGHGIDLFRDISNLFVQNIFIHDRSHVITTPFRTRTMEQCRLPKFVPVSSEFEEICNDSADAILEQLQNSNRKAVLMYSGGIDSTLLLVTLLKRWPSSVLLDQLIVLMDENSINENPKFYRDHISGKITVAHSKWFDEYVGNDRYLILFGEGNDQLFGSQVLYQHEDHFGSTPWDRAIDSSIEEWFVNGIGQADGEQAYAILDQVCAAAPIAIDTVYKWFWWINFTCKWQNVYLRSAGFIKPKNQKSWKPGENYVMFFGNTQFQLWSMNNSNSLIADSFRNNKQVCKNIIYDYNKDSYYRDRKLKQGSLGHIFLRRTSASCIDDSMRFYYDFDLDNWVNPFNSFT
jgi:hypothetical protein